LLLATVHVHFSFFFFTGPRPHRALHSFPTRRSSDLSRGSRVSFQVSNLSGDVYDTDLAHAILISPAASIRAIASVLQVMRDYAYDGVVLDLQNVLPSDRKALADFVSDLAAQLHGRGRPLSVVVPAKAAPASRTDADAYDLKALGRAADWL